MFWQPTEEILQSKLFNKKDGLKDLNYYRKNFLRILNIFFILFINNNFIYGAEALKLKTLKVKIPEVYLAKDGDWQYGGDCRVGDLTGNGEVDFVIYRSSQGGDKPMLDDGGLKPCYIAAFDIKGKPLWEHGHGGAQPVRPGPVSVYDINNDGVSEIICLWHKPNGIDDWLSLGDVTLQIRDGLTGNVILEKAPSQITQKKVENRKQYTWIHQRILIANFRGLECPRDILLKIGNSFIAMDDNLEVLWHYEAPIMNNTKPPKFPVVGDLNGDGMEEVFGGYFLLSNTGKPYWEKNLADIIDSVCIEKWDNGKPRAIGSAGHIMSINGDSIIKLNENISPHGQELKVGDFIENSFGPEMIIRNHGHRPDIVIVSNAGNVLKELKLNYTPNHTGMEKVTFLGKEKQAFLVNGRYVWDFQNEISYELEGLPEATKRKHRMGFYHVIPSDLNGDGKEDAIMFDPTSKAIYILSTAQLSAGNTNFRQKPNQYNARLMD